MLGATSKWFHKTVMEESIWRFACLRDLQVPRPFPVSSSWNKIYASAFGNNYYTQYTSKRKNITYIVMGNADGSHSYLFHQKEKHIGQSLNLIHQYFLSHVNLDVKPYGNSLALKVVHLLSTASFYLVLTLSLQTGCVLVPLLLILECHS